MSDQGNSTYAGQTKYKILIVDDDAEVLETLVENVGDILTEAKIISASNGLVALEVLKQNTPDIIITDLVMPEMGGEELITEVRKTQMTLPIIVLSAHHVNHEINKKYRNVVLLNKPLEIALLTRSITSFLNIKPSS